MMSTGRRLTKTETKQITKQSKKFSPERPNLGHRVDRKLPMNHRVYVFSAHFLSAHKYSVLEHECERWNATWLEFLMGREHLDGQGVKEMIFSWTLKQACNWFIWRVPISMLMMLQDQQNTKTSSTTQKLASEDRHDCTEVTVITNAAKFVSLCHFQSAFVKFE
jgi:hypothetical protein